MNLSSFENHAAAAQKELANSEKRFTVTFKASSVNRVMVLLLQAMFALK
jgi:hypothetical protein